MSAACDANHRAGDPLQLPARKILHVPVLDLEQVPHLAHLVLLVHVLRLDHRLEIVLQDLGVVVMQFETKLTRVLRIYK